jgi:hypothetical protein
VLWNTIHSVREDIPYFNLLANISYVHIYALNKPVSLFEFEPVIHEPLPIVNTENWEN